MCTPGARSEGRRSMQLRRRVGLVAALLVILASLRATHAQEADFAQKFLQGDPETCQAYLESRGINALANPALDTPQSSAWDPSSVILSWRTQLFQGKTDVLWGTHVFPGMEDILLQSQLEAGLADLESRLRNAATPCGATCQAAQRDALLAIFGATNGPSWPNTGMSRIWTSGVHHCCWPGVKCCSADNTLPVIKRSGDKTPVKLTDSRIRAVACVQPGGVSSLDLSRAGRDTEAGDSLVTRTGGSLPAGALEPLRSSLEYLSLAGLGLSGTIPREVLRLVMLRNMHLEDNQFTGTIPEGTTGISGSDPGWPLHARMTILFFSDNQLTGVVPASIEQMLSLTYLSLSGNSLDSTNAQLSLMPQLSVIEIAHNAFTSLSTSIFSPSTIDAAKPPGIDQYFSEETYADLGLVHASAPRGLRVVNARRNNLAGTLSASIFVADMEELDLGQNRLTGTLPALLGSQDHLRRLYLDENDLEGSLPEPLSHWAVQTLDIAGNERIMGTIPVTLADMSGLQVLRMDNTSLFGPLPAKMGEMVMLHSIELLDALVSHPKSQRNSRDELLPEFIRFTEQIVVQPVDAGIGGDAPLQCPGVAWVGQSQRNRVTIRLSPFFYHYEGCHCPVGTEIRSVPIANSEAIMSRWNLIKQSPSYPANDAAWEREHLPAAVPICKAQGDSLMIVLVASLVPAVVVILLTAAILFYFLRRSFAVAMLERRKRAGPPTGSREVTLVLTDVEDSTMIWETMPAEMSVANALHDAIMRRNLARWFGYEVLTEGDSFLVAFHEPADAVGWCLSVHQELQAAEWPPALSADIITGSGASSGLKSRRVTTLTDVRGGSSPRTTPEDASSDEPSPEVKTAVSGGSEGDKKSAASSSNPSETLVMTRPTTRVAPSANADASHATSLMSRAKSAPPDPVLVPMGPEEAGGHLFRGLLVRMGVATATVTRSKTHRVTRRIEYEGPAVQRVNLIQDSAHGGQVLVCERTFELLSRGPVKDLLKKINSFKPAKMLNAFLNQVQYGVDARNARVSNQTVDPATMGNPSRGLSLHVSKNAVVPEDSQITPPDAARPHRHTFSSRVSSQNTAIGSRKTYVTNVDSEHGSTVNLKVEHGAEPPAASLSNSNGRKGKDAREGHDDIVVLDMGEQSLGKAKTLVHVFQILVPGLEERARFFPPVENPITPSYFHAPGTLTPILPDISMCSHFSAYTDCEACWVRAALPDVTIVFCTPCDIDDIIDEARNTGNKAMATYRAAVRSTLPRFDGYECQELNGAFMMAFSSLRQAYLWAVSFQSLLPTLPWPPKLMNMKYCAPTWDEDGAFIRGGLRVKIGVCEGRPLRVMPHPATGRADYFGPLVNRAARLCFVSAQPGQVVGPLDQLGRAVAEMATSTDCGGFFRSAADRQSDTGQARTSALESNAFLPPTGKVEAAPGQALLLQQASTGGAVRSSGSLTAPRPLAGNLAAAGPGRKGKHQASCFEVFGNSETMFQMGPEIGNVIAAGHASGALASGAFSSGALTSGSLSKSQREDSSSQSRTPQQLGSGDVVGALPTVQSGKTIDCIPNATGMPPRPRMDPAPAQPSRLGVAAVASGPLNAAPARREGGMMRSVTIARAHNSINTRAQGSVATEIPKVIGREAAASCMTLDSATSREGRRASVASPGALRSAMKKEQVAAASTRKMVKLAAAMTLNESGDDDSGHGLATAPTAGAEALRREVLEVAAMAKNKSFSTRDVRRAGRMFSMTRSRPAPTRADLRASRAFKIDKRQRRGQRDAKQDKNGLTWTTECVHARIDHIGRFRLKGVQGEFDIGALAVGDKTNPIPRAPKPGAIGKKGTLLAPPAGLVMKLQILLPTATLGGGAAAFIGRTDDVRQSELESRMLRSSAAGDAGSGNEDSSRPASVAFTSGHAPSPAPVIMGAPGPPPVARP
ncbi:unnamed protein product [Pedinophyceae sp. YPF-701]|nr:unnamed protein product [Pedinophyceae sp. YPF-701]